MARLGPLVGGSAAPSPAIVAQVDRFAWRRASLFVAIDDDAGEHGLVAADQQPESVEVVAVQPAITSALDHSKPPSSAPSDALFAVRRPE